MKSLSIDIETYSSENLAKCGVYRYCQSPDFEILLFGYSADGGPVQVVDLANGEVIPDEVICALVDDKIIKWAFNAQFERICLSRYLGGSVSTYLNPAAWHCTMIWAATLGLPLSLEGVGAVLGLEKQKMKEGKDLIRYFCTPAKAKDGATFRHLPKDAPEKWEIFKAYNLRDVETEMAIQAKLSKFPVSESEWRNYTLDQQINDRGIMLDMTLVNQAIACDDQFKRTHMDLARSVTGLDNPNSPSQLKDWLTERGIEVESLSKAAVLELLEKADGEVELALSLRQELAKSSVKKYTAMASVAGSDSRARGLIQFYGANRTGRYAGRLVQVQNLPQNHLPDLETVRSLIRNGQFDTVELLYDSVPLVLSELIRTAFVPKPGCRFYVADFSAIEARVIAWMAGEQWRQQVFADGKDIYCASASQMFSYKPLPGAEDAIYRQIADITISMKAVDHLAMPACVINEVKVSLSEKERKAYDTMKAEMVLSLGGKEIDAGNAAALSNKLSQMANGAVYDDDRHYIELHSRKLDALEDLIESANGKPVLVAYWFKHDLERIQKRFPVREISSSADIAD